MLFNSFTYLWFLPCVVIVYFSLPHKYRWILLLGASYYFYMCWKAEYIVLIILSTLIDYFSAIGIGTSKNKFLRRLCLGVSLTGNLSLLFFFKYYNFAGQNLQAVFDSFNILANVPVYHFLLPVGISFYTFQTMSYTIDVYKGSMKPERHLGYFALYVTYFPQLVAGPIERSERLLPQLRQEHRFDPDRALSGMRLIIWGLFKKVVVADRLSVYVQTVYDSPTEYAGFPLIIGTIFFAYQIYCDFSGYSDIAIGSARLIGVDLMKNFDTPYYSKSIREFWSRWHISLSTWFRDYVYIPLGGSRVKVSRFYLNLLITFLVSGFWHGANWTFIVWGFIHGISMVLSAMTAGFRERLAQVTGLSRLPLLRSAIQSVSVLGIVLLSWVFFRADSIEAAFTFIGEAAKLDFARIGMSVARGPFYFVLSVASILLLESIQLLMKYDPIALKVRSARPALQWGAMYAGIMVIVFFGSYDTPNQFIYFQF